MNKFRFTATTSSSMHPHYNQDFTLSMNLKVNIFSKPQWRKLQISLSQKGKQNTKH